MKIMKRASLYAVIVCMMLVSSAWAGPFEAGDVPAGAKWVVHLDAQKLFSSEIGRFLLGQLEEEGDMAEIEAFGTVMEFDITKDLHSVTAFGTDFEDEEGVVIFRGRFDAEKIEALIRTEGKLKKIGYEDSTILKWSDGRETFYVCFYEPKVIVFGNNMDLVGQAISVMDGDAPSMRGGGVLKGMRSLPEGTFISAAANAFQDLIPDDEDHAELLKKAEKVFVVVGEEEGENFVKVALQVSDEETAEMIYDIGKGLLAVGSLVGGIEEPELADLIRAVDLKWDGRKIVLQVSKSTRELKRLLKDNMH